MIDLNDIEQLKKLNEAARSDDGQIIIGYLQTRLEAINKQINDISLKESDQSVWGEYRRIETVRRELMDIIKFLVSQYEDNN
jgi:hypothetical protein